MTTFGQAEFEALGLLEKKHTTSVRVTRTLTNHPDMLTDKELQVTCLVSRVTCPQHCQPCFCRTSLQCSALWKLVSEKLRWIRKCLYKGMDICDLH